MSEPKESCENCRFYRDGDCRRNPPTFRFINDGICGGKIKVAEFPPAPGWCGEWKAKEDGDD